MSLPSSPQQYGPQSHTRASICERKVLCRQNRANDKVWNFYIEHAQSATGGDEQAAIEDFSSQHTSASTSASLLTAAMIGIPTTKKPKSPRRDRERLTLGTGAHYRDYDCRCTKIIWDRMQRQRTTQSYRSLVSNNSDNDRNHYAVIIQSLVRKELQRRRYKAALSLSRGPGLTENEAAIRIQSALRGMMERTRFRRISRAGTTRNQQIPREVTLKVYVPRRRTQKERPSLDQRIEEAAVRIQKITRGASQRKLSERMAEAAVQIQKLTRGASERKLRERQAEAAVHIQCIARGASEQSLTAAVDQIEPAVNSPDRALPRASFPVQSLSEGGSPRSLDEQTKDESQLHSDNCGNDSVCASPESNLSQRMERAAARFKKLSDEMRRSQRRLKRKRAKAAAARAKEEQAQDKRGPPQRNLSHWMGKAAVHIQNVARTASKRNLFEKLDKATGCIQRISKSQRNLFEHMDRASGRIQKFSRSLSQRSLFRKKSKRGGRRRTGGSVDDDDDITEEKVTFLMPMRKRKHRETIIRVGKAAGRQPPHADGIVVQRSPPLASSPSLRTTTAIPLSRATNNTANNNKVLLPKVPFDFSRTKQQQLGGEPPKIAHVEITATNAALKQVYKKPQVDVKRRWLV